MKIDAAEASAGTLMSGDLEPHPGNDADWFYTLNCTGSTPSTAKSRIWSTSQPIEVVN